MDRYDRNKTMISQEQQDLLKGSKVCVLGCGGLGGHIIEMLTRLGIGTLTVVDGDVFDQSNLNRQLLSNEETIGYNKASIAKKKMAIVNSEIMVHAVEDFITEENGLNILNDQDIVVDALDNIKIRMKVVHMCKQLNIPYVYGAIAGWYGQVSTILPGDETMSILNKSSRSKGEETKLGNPSFTPALVASVQVSEVLKLVTGKGELLRNSFLHINMLDHEYEVFKLN